MSSKQLLYRLFESEHFNSNPFLPVAYLSRYAHEIGIHHYLCSKLRQFSYGEIEFFLPQLCHLTVSIETTESVALEDFIIELCEQSAHGALLTFWLFQTYLHDLRANPQALAFKTCRRISNKVQHIVFGSDEQPKKREKIRENVLPVTILASLVLGAIGLPAAAQYAAPLAIAQARKPQTSTRTITDAPMVKLSRSKTVGHSPTARQKKEKPPKLKTSEITTISSPVSPTRSMTPESSNASPIKSKPEIQSYSLANSRRPSLNAISTLGVPSKNVASTSLPDLRMSRTITSPTIPTLNGLQKKKKERPILPSLVPTHKKIHMLRSNYFRSQTQFLTALEDISNRLVAVPKQARLSALRAELALLNNDLPAEVDIPVICPATLREPQWKTTHHRVVRVNPAEATVLNSAERVPYLLMIEVLRDDFDFDPEKEKNQTLIANMLVEESDGNRRRIFDLSEAPRETFRGNSVDSSTDSVFEPAKGDIGASPLLSEFEFESRRGSASDSTISPPPHHIPRLSSGATTLATLSSIATPRSSELSNSRSGSPGPKRPPFSPRGTGPEQSDLSALATHMRTAAHMLAQLDASSSKRPKDEVAAIKAKIIASMQTLEEESFFFEETAPVPTFDAIMANAAADAAASEVVNAAQNREGGESPKTAFNVQAGVARMENDQKTSGVERKADRDDPSAATFGEEWTAKKERIRKSSPYGFCSSWDLLSVIVKTGADLRQEAFACQLIQVCTKIWEDAGVAVWTKRMRILVTGESSGLIETITNGTSLHSLKRSLTIASIASGKNPRGRIATLKDHFTKTFGDVTSESYKSAEDAFVRSLAAYSIICYILQLKDRHNGNILIDNQGHIIHIDFGFMLSNSPGSLGFESAPFKLTQEYVDVIGGQNSERFQQFRALCKQSFQALRKRADDLIDLVEMMGRESRMPCFASGVAYATMQLRERFQLKLSEQEAETFVDEYLINKSLGSYYTRAYDAFQYRSQGIY
ncbi:kinase-like domain-containing protein [Kalaharituber pfeilii]|nr:kinase-like domain-containing protein [Kalaharituber pfeilii]